VQGPFGTFIGGNNELALALVMTIPLIRYLQLQEKHHLVKVGLSIGMFLTVIAAIGSQSRGALVALLLTGLIFWIKSRKKFVTAVFIIVAGLAVISIMPESWYARMNTINSYESDGSAMGRINAWWTAWNLATHRFFGGGFEMWQIPVFQQYAPNPGDVHDAHSIYFKVLGEHGFVGLFLFLLLLGMVWFKCRSIIKISKNYIDKQWASDLAAMVQVSMVAYLTGGAFLGLAYFDYIYHLMAVVVVVHYLVKEPELAGQGSAQVNPSETRSNAGLSAIR
jgi:probable O-glycosylation ligase (exosortase A-associated)